MTGAEVAIVVVGIEWIADVAIWAVSSFAISMGLIGILESVGFKLRRIKEGKKDDIPKMVEEIIQSYPGCKEYIKNKNKPFLDYTISSRIGIYSDENLGDIHFFPGYMNIKDIFISSGFKITPKEYIPEPEVFPINNDDRPKNLPHPIDEPIDIGLAKNPPISVPVDTGLPKNLPHPIDEPIPKTIPNPVFIPHETDKVIKITFSKISDVVKKIPRKLRKNDGYVDIDKFKNGIKVKGKKAYKEEDGWIIEKDTGKHGQKGKEQWKLKDKEGNRVATLGEDGKILKD